MQKPKLLLERTPSTYPWDLREITSSRDTMEKVKGKQMSAHRQIKRAINLVLEQTLNTPSHFSTITPSSHLFCKYLHNSYTVYKPNVFWIQGHLPAFMQWMLVEWTKVELENKTFFVSFSRVCNFWAHLGFLWTQSITYLAVKKEDIKKKFKTTTTNNNNKNNNNKKNKNKKQNKKKWGHREINRHTDGTRKYHA